MHKNTRSKCRQVWTLQAQRGRGWAFENQTGPIKTWPGRLWEKPHDRPPEEQCVSCVASSGPQWPLQSKQMWEMVRQHHKPDQRTRILSADRHREVDKDRERERGRYSEKSCSQKPSMLFEDVTSKATFQLFSGHYDMLYHMHCKNQHIQAIDSILMMYYSIIHWFIHLLNAFTQSHLHCIQCAHLTFCPFLLSLGIKPMILAFLEPLSTV